uniref:Uncharacterized protein n=1 Tax=OCS116 cluster bacterium TaxID=2030921 RepID=A0A2A4YQV4_9PROT
MSPNAPPRNVSSPALPTNIFTPLSPINVSLPALPVRFSMSNNVSPAASPPLPALPSRLTFTAVPEAE